MSPFVLVKKQLQHERCGASEAPTSKTQDAETTASGGVIVTSVRQLKRLCKAYQTSGAAGLISKLRGQPSNNHGGSLVITRESGIHSLNEPIKL
jgi:hypothetical protein